MSLPSSFFEVKLWEPHCSCSALKSNLIKASFSVVTPGDPEH